MHPGNYAVLAVAGALGGALNALAGGGTFITLPALMFTGATPVLANTSSTFALWPGMIASLFAYRRHLAERDHPMILYAVMAVLGSSLGALLLLKSSNHLFLTLLPYLLLIATVLFVFGNRVTAWASAEGTAPRWLTHCLLLLIAVYGGYFGGGMGIMTLAVLSVIGMRDIHEMNALKSLWTTTINASAVAIFLVTGKLDWTRGLVTMAGCVAGGYVAARFAQKIPRRWVRGFVITVASAMTLYYFNRLRL